MFKRVSLYLVKNLFKLIPTFILFIVFVTVISTLSYVILTISAAKGNEVDNNVNVTYNINDFDTVSYIDDYDRIYDEATASGEVKAHRIDFVYPTVMFLNTQIDNIHLMYDENEIDFLNETNTIIDGKFSDNGVLISDKMADKYNLSVGEKLDAVSVMYINQSEVLSDDAILMGIPVITADNLVQGVSAVPMEITGIYTSTDYKKIVGMKNELGTLYIGNEIYRTYEETTVSQKSVVEGLIPNEMLNYVDGSLLSRFLVVYESKEDASAFIDAMSDDKMFKAQNTYDSYKKALEPLDSISNVFIIASAIAIIFMSISIYLNNYLLIEKRSNEIISLLTFGVTKFKIGIQTVIEMSILLVVSLPFGFLLTKTIGPTILEVVKKYYVITIKKGIDAEADNGIMFGNDLPYYSIDTENLINFNSISLLACLLIAFIVSIIIICLISFVESQRSIKHIGRM